MERYWSGYIWLDPMLNSAIKPILNRVYVEKPCYRGVSTSAISSQHRQGGAAILMALIVVAIAATMAATMLARQQASLVGEEARRHATQARWILRGAMDWTRLILREGVKGNVVSLDQVWAYPLKPISLKTFLAANERTDDAVFDAMLEGYIEDAQAKFNLRNLVDDKGQPAEAPVAAMEKLLKLLNLSDAKKVAIEAGANIALLDQSNLFEPRSALDMMPSLNPEQRELLGKYITLLPQKTTVNVNTASAQVIAAVVPNLDLPIAKSIVARRTVFNEITQFTGQIPGLKVQGAAPINVSSIYFEVTGIVLWDALTIEQHALVERRQSGIGAPTVVNVVKVSYGPTMPVKP
jgi:general secretion pathway protein K